MKLILCFLNCLRTFEWKLVIITLFLTNELFKKVICIGWPVRSSPSKVVKKCPKLTRLIEQLLTCAFNELVFPLVHTIPQSELCNVRVMELTFAAPRTELCMVVELTWIALGRLNRTCKELTDRDLGPTSRLESKLIPPTPTLNSRLGKQQSFK